VVVGGFREEAGTVDAPIARHPKERKRMAVVSGGKRAVTHWRVVERFNGCTWVECQLETGRTHQIRVHMAHIHRPLLGDTVYGAKKPYPGLAGQCLHAGRLRFTHPSTGEVMEVEAPLPDYFKAVVEKFRSC
jgi:23S rRNA pseudouridine1911/1915/1917 synthase